MTETLVQSNHFNAPPATVFAAIADSAQHTAMTGAPAEIGVEPGSAFTTHGGAIQGWMLDIAANERIVQAWRPGDWPAGVYSVVRYDFAPHEEGTLLTLTHSSIPEGGSVHLEAGWNERYWAPLAKHLES